MPEYGDAKCESSFLAKTLIGRYECDYEDLSMDELYEECEEFSRAPFFGGG